MPRSARSRVTPGEALRTHRPVRIERIVSGGQTGVDRAALDVALQLGIACGGWCPRGRLAEDGRIADRYPLEETPDRRYAQRTEWNVRDADGSLILTVGKPRGGTALTVRFARKLERPYFVVDLDKNDQIDDAAEWLTTREIRILNIAGPRASQQPGIEIKAREFLRNLLEKT